MINIKNTIVVEYDGDWPAACMGRLKIFNGPELIYDKQFCCHSTGSVCLEGDPKEWNWVINDGNLIWDQEDAYKFSEEIQQEVADKLSDVRVCCGGCI